MTETSARIAHHNMNTTQFYQALTTALRDDPEVQVHATHGGVLRLHRGTNTFYPLTYLAYKQGHGIIKEACALTEAAPRIDYPQDAANATIAAADGAQSFYWHAATTPQQRRRLLRLLGTHTKKRP